MESQDGDFDWQPLYLSSIAGASTCIGAAVVFCFPPSKKDPRQRQVPPGMMAFSLALAGSVMVTVSFISILPECLMDDGIETGRDEENEEGMEEHSFKMIPIMSWMMFGRVFFFTMGCALYFILSSFFVAEPEELMNSESFNVLVGTDNVEKNDLEKCNDHHPQSILESMNDKNETTSTASHSGTTSMEEDITREGDETRPILLETLDGSPISKSIRGRKTAMKSSSSQNSRKAGAVSPSPSKDEKLKTSSPNKKVLGSNVQGFGAWTTGKDLQSKEKQKAWRLAMLLFISLLVHNFPEGLAVAASALESKSLGITVTIGIMIHNIPEGIAIAIPCLAARPDQPWLSFALASVSGLAEPFGAFVALMFLRGVEKTSESVMSLENILAFVAGIMVIVAVWELFPEARRHITDTSAYFWGGTIFGIIVMVLTETYLP